MKPLICSVQFLLWGTILAKTTYAYDINQQNSVQFIPQHIHPSAPVYICMPVDAEKYMTQMQTLGITNTPTNRTPRYRHFNNTNSTIRTSEYKPQTNYSQHHSQTYSPQPSVYSAPSQSYSTTPPVPVWNPTQKFNQNQSMFGVPAFRGENYSGNIWQFSINQTPSTRYYAPKFRPDDGIPPPYQ